MTTEDFQRKLAAILIADVVGYSRLMQDNEEATVSTLNKYKEMIFGLIDRHNGRLVDSPGDNLLAEFVSVVDAMKCAVQIQEDLKGNNEVLPPNRKMEFRIGINIGDVIHDGDRIYGDGVNVAARIESLADAGGICISGTAYDQVITKLDMGYEYLGEHNVKNITVPVRVYRVLMGSETAGKVIGEKRFLGRISRGTAIATFISLIIIAAGLLFWNIYSHQSSKKEPASTEPEQASVVSGFEEATKTIAVLPFENLSSDPEQVYFVDGLSEEIQNSLAQIPDLNVIGWISSFSFKGTNKKVQEIARELGVGNILMGSVRKAGNALRITAKLLRGSDGIHLWSATYDRELKDIFTIQEDIAAAVAGELKLTLGIGKSIKQLGGTDNSEAYGFYLVALGQIHEYSSSSKFNRSLELLDTAISLDPEFALAWAVKATYYLKFAVEGPADIAATAIDEALVSAQKAVELEPGLADGYVSLGFIKTGKGDFIDAGSAFRKALGLMSEPLMVNAMYFTALYYHAVGHFKKAHGLFVEIRENDPLYQSACQQYIFNLAFQNNRQRAEEEYERGMLLFGDSWVQGNEHITIARLGAGNIRSSEEILHSNHIYDKVKAYLESPEDGLEALRRIITDEDNLSSDDFAQIALWAAYLGDYDFAMDSMEKSVRINGLHVFFFWFPVMQEVRQQIRFKEFVKKIGLVDYWNEYGWPDICRPLDNGDFECD
jgi:TolB-like protein/class 3 adenylate cyclase/Tfp pilus assembly protein PilF